MKKLVFLFFALATVLLLDSCVNSKQVTYFQNIDSISLAASRNLYDARIMPKDQLIITVNTTDPVAARPFNLMVTGTMGLDGKTSGSQNSMLRYLVDNSGNIVFPVLGTLHVQGLTKEQCQELIRERLKPYLASSELPVVTVNLASYRVSVIGEVNKPGVIPVEYEKLSVIEALAHAGDLTIYGRRDNVLLIRENAEGEKQQYRLNLNDANLINSPYYYLQQNDIVYVEPNKAKAKSSDIGQSTTIWFSVISIVTSIASLIVNITR